MGFEMPSPFREDGLALLAYGLRALPPWLIPFGRRGLTSLFRTFNIRGAMMTKGRKTGGRQPISPAGPAVHVGFRLPREVVADLKAVAEARSTAPALQHRPRRDDEGSEAG